MLWKAFTYWFNKIIRKACNLPLNITDKNKSEFKMMITEINLRNTDIKRKKNPADCNIWTLKLATKLSIIFG